MNVIDTDEPIDCDWSNQPPPEDVVSEDDPAPHDFEADPKSTFELVFDLVRAQREAEPSDKWYGDWDDTYIQHNALDRALQRHTKLESYQLANEYDKFRLHTSQHLWWCSLVSEAPHPAPPDLGPLKGHEAAKLREIAALLRTPEGARPDLTHSANEALAALYEAHATLGEALWDEHGGTCLWEEHLPKAERA